MLNTVLKRCSISLPIRKLKPQQYYYLPITLKLKKRLTIPSVDKATEEQKVSNTAKECQRYNQHGNSLKISQKANYTPIT